MDSGSQKRMDAKDVSSEKTTDASPSPAVVRTSQQPPNRNGENLMDSKLICSFVIFTLLGNAYDVMRNSHWGLAAHLLSTITVLFQIFYLIGNVATHGPRLPRRALDVMLVVLILDMVVSFINLYYLCFGS
ncbi:hypothetical protein GLAREA_02948 [Glarea lozoyensis ATCC 20868]|uniref:Uncharacterized protein n=1 Tax=Glarea lozoyensis (strain ATCC 20868 / MF5171) TaxID=1116229 RepID=S3CPF0_GLAL2|nr:uncharacterized protein GLAREA_02948 [Glarea lozoyensis ATCC 20868]EPE27034.1 hypothetical protein GLAREA_02948 [Glarea lozoyensis ATCC 20868]